MKATILPVQHWPYGIIVEADNGQIVLRPERKARAGWSQAFESAKSPADELSGLRAVHNDFDAKEWEWWWNGSACIW